MRGAPRLVLLPSGLLAALLLVASLSQAAPMNSREVGRIYSDGLIQIDRGDIARGFALIEEAARAGHIEAAHELGLRLVLGDAGRVDLEEGIRWLTIAARRDRAQAQYDLALALQRRASAGDHEQAHDWLRAASRVGHSDATFGLGVKRLLGEAADWDAPETLARLRELQRSSHPEATHLLASALASGRGVAPNVEQAIQLFNRAIALGDSDAHTELRAVLSTVPPAERRRLMMRAR